VSAARRCSTASVHFLSPPVAQYTPHPLPLDRRTRTCSPRQRGGKVWGRGNHLRPPAHAHTHNTRSPPIFHASEWMIRPSSTSSPPLRARFPSRTLLLYSLKPRAPVFLRSLSLPPLSVAHAHTHNTRSLHVHHWPFVVSHADAERFLRGVCGCSPRF